jgi:MFS family permease
MATDTSNSAMKTGFFINRNFMLLWWGQAISIIGDVVFQTTLLLWIAYDLARNATWGPLAASGIFLCTVVPMLAIRPLAGVFADRWDKRRTMLRTDIARAISVVLLLFLTGAIPVPLFPGEHIPLGAKLAAIYIAMLAISVLGQLFNPSRLALTGDIVPEPLRARAFGFAYVTENLAYVIGVPLGATLFLTGVAQGLTLNALSYVISFLTIFFIHSPKAARSVNLGGKGNVLRELREAAHFFVRDRLLLTLCLSIFIATLGFGCINSMLVFFNRQNLHGSPAVYSYLVIAVGIGAMAGAGLASLFAERVGMKRTFWISVVLMGILIVLFSRLTDPWLAVDLAFVIGIPQSAVNVAIGPFLLSVAPRDMVGRISSLFEPIVVIAQLASIATAGYLAGVVLAGLHGTLLGITYGPIDTIFTGAGVLAVCGGLYAMIWLPSKPASEVADEKADR